MLEERGLYPLTNDMIVLWQDTYNPIEFTYLEDYNWQEFNLS
jgi:hypothetical protein